MKGALLCLVGLASGYVCAPNARGAFVPRQPAGARRPRSTALAPARGDGLIATVRATRALSRGDAVVMLYRPLDLLATAERRAVLREAYGWTCACAACANGRGDALLLLLHPLHPVGLRCRLRLELRLHPLPQQLTLLAHRRQS